MAKKIYIGDASGVPRFINDGYIGIDDVARKILCVYVGDSEGIARRVFERSTMLVTGITFNAKTPEVTSIVFTDEKVPNTYTLGDFASTYTYVDLSVDGRGGVVGWLDGTTYKISTQKTGVKVFGNENCSYMFERPGLTSIDFTNFDTSNVTNMSYMFNNCALLTSLDLSNFDNSNATTMAEMFSGTLALESITLGPKWKWVRSSWDIVLRRTYGLTGNWISSDGITYDTDLKLAEAYNADPVGMSGAFTKATKSTSLVDGNTFYAAIPTEATSVVFTDEVVPSGYTLGDTVTTTTYVDLSVDTDEGVIGWLEGTTYKVSTQRTGVKVMGTNCGYMFAGCTGLTSIDLSNFDTRNVTSMNRMFYSCSRITSLDVSSFNTSNVGTMTYMFTNCVGLTSLDLSNFNTSNVTNMSYMFYNCKGLTSLDLSNFNTSNVTTMQSMFRNCNALTSLDLSNFNTSNVTIMSYMFCDCNSLTSLNLSSFDTSNVTSMAYMFEYCESLTSIDLSGFDTSKVTNMNGITVGCYELEQITLGPKWNFVVTFITPSSSYIPGADGKWYSESGTGYTPAELKTAYNANPSGMAGTYYATPR